jgi:acyl dehydratase
MRFYEDLDVGETDAFGSYQISREEIVEFAEKYDPQPMHLDETVAEDSIFDELIASGWQTAALTMRLTVEHDDEVATLAGVGLDNLRWERPLKPGDTLSLRTEIVDKRLSERHDDRGYVTRRVEGVNQDGDVVISYDGIALVRRRPEA